PKRRVEPLELPHRNSLRLLDPPLRDGLAVPGIHTSSVAIDDRGPVAPFEELTIVQVNLRGTVAQDRAVLERPPQAGRPAHVPRRGEDRRWRPVANVSLVVGHLRERVLREEGLADQDVGGRAVERAAERAAIATPEVTLGAPEVVIV